MSFLLEPLYDLRPDQAGSADYYDLHDLTSHDGFERNVTSRPLATGSRSRSTRMEQSDLAASPRHQPSGPQAVIAPERRDQCYQLASPRTCSRSDDSKASSCGVGIRRIVFDGLMTCRVGGL